jgi:hypothetical protein
MVIIGLPAFLAVLGCIHAIVYCRFFSVRAFRPALCGDASGNVTQKRSFKARLSFFSFVYAALSVIVFLSVYHLTHSSSSQ